MKKSMYYLCLFAMSFMSFSTATFGQERLRANSAYPTISAGTTTTTITFAEKEYNFGTVEAGEQVQHTFTFTNTGEKPLIISNARGSCGCTVPMWPREPIVPGETASITVNFDSTNKKGPRNQKVTITANTDPTQTFLYLKGEVLVPDADAAPTEITPAEETLSLDCIAIYPNPTADVLKLDLKESIGQAATIAIYSKSGQLMAERKIRTIDGTIEFDVNHYPNGTYVANVQVKGKLPLAQCFVVER